MHCLRTVEGKHGNPLSEVRVLADSLMDNGGAMTVEGAIKLSPELSVLGIREGEQIRLSEADFVRLAEAFFAEIRRKFV